LEAIALGTIAYLILFPILIALILLVIRHDAARSIITVIGALFTAVGSVFLAIEFMGQPQQLSLDASLVQAVGYAVVAIDAVLCLYIICKGIYWKKYIAVILALCQLGLALYLDFSIANGISVQHVLYIDNLSIIMALVIGIVGGGIAIYAIGYMRVHEAHFDGPDRRYIFFSVIFAFLGAMFGVVFSNSLTWMLCAWEVTTVCSFALIGYTREKIAIRNAFIQIVLNLIGGICFTAALIWIGKVYDVMELDRFISFSISLTNTGNPMLTYVPLILLSLAAFTKAAQMPFHVWLLGAMVAPTPTSALLHSSTMVKAGVFLLIKLAPCLGFNLPGYIVMIVGGVTFLFAALAAISQSNAKRVLAYSTISNLGLITACAGVGSSEAVWAAIFLLIFHAVAKSLLFLCVGTAEHHIGSRNIEDMDDLFERMPRLARLMAIGIMGMFIAPFGMLISKWAALQAFADSQNVILMMLLVFGSAATFMFWAKWLGKILAIANSDEEDVELTVSRSEWSALGLMTVLTVGCCIAFPLISSAVVVPYLSTVFSNASASISDVDLWIMAVIALVIALIFLGYSGTTKRREVPVYLSGIRMDGPTRTFRNSFGQGEEATQRNWYMQDLFGEKKMQLIGVVVTLAVILGAGCFVTQSVAVQKSDIKSVASEINAYQDSYWGQNNADFSEYLQYYNYYESYYEQYKDEFKEEYGINSMEDLMNELYIEASSQSSSSSSSDSSSSSEDTSSSDSSSSSSGDSTTDSTSSGEGE
jgi:ech hydrogenase subunit A